LLLPAGRFLRVVIKQFFDPHYLGGLLAALLDGLLALFAAHLEAEPDVPAGGKVGVQGVVLEHHCQVPLPGLLVRDRFPIEQYLAFSYGLKAGDHPEDRGLAAPGGPTRTTNSPSSIESDTSSTASRSSP
jgi:hypothetical protein